MNKERRLHSKPATDNCGANTSFFGPNDPYVRFLLDRKDRTFYMKPYNGNSGDLLIWLGTEYLLRDLGITRTLDPQAADVILIPGGNQTMWQANVDIWKEIWAKWPDKEFVVGPTTVRFGVTEWRDEINQSHNFTGFFARDPDSFTTLSGCGLSDRMTIGLSHDPALHLRDSELIRAHRAAGTDEYVLACFRTDHERALDRAERTGRWERLAPGFVLRRLERRRADAAQERKIAHVMRCSRRKEPLRVCDAPKFVFECFVEIVRSAAEVHTDRLHCMLLAAMLGKPTFAYPTAYGKLEAVYKHSVKDWARVECVGDTQPPAGHARQ